MSDWNYEDCVITTYIWTYAWLLSKACMYAVFLMRLDMVYANSAYGYNKLFIYCIIVLVIITSTTLSTILVSSMNEAEFLTDSDQFPNPCFVYLPAWGYTSFLIYDFIANIFCLILFLIPLYRASKAVDKAVASPSHSKTRRKMIYIGIKCMILTATCVATTVLTLSMLSIGYIGWMCAVDVAVNCVCVLLMTPYYEDRYYYERLCYVCLYKCPDEYRKSKGKAKTQTSRSRVQTIDPEDEPQDVGPKGSESKGLTVDTEL